MTHSYETFDHTGTPGADRTIFSERFDANARIVENGLESWLTADRLGCVPPRLLEAMRYGVLGGGKRLRPFLLIESARLFGIAPEQALNAACALECVHCYSLIHDDLPAMDDDADSRGRPTVQKVLGEATYILAGDALLTAAFEIMARPGTHADASVRSSLCVGLAQASGGCGMAGGQALDLEASGNALTEADIRRLQGMKTGALIRFACEAGALLGEAQGTLRAALSGYGAFLGAAFQLADDLLDAEGEAAIVGKATGKDDRAGKATLVALMGIERSRLALTELRDVARRALAPFGGDGATLAEAADFVILRNY
jgi:farnesyl diphosphate synthase